MTAYGHQPIEGRWYTILTISQQLERGWRKWNEERGSDLGCSVAIMYLKSFCLDGYVRVRLQRAHFAKHYHSNRVSAETTNDVGAMSKSMSLSR